MREWPRLLRYYQAGLVNLAFGFGLYALFVAFGMNIFIAQIGSHLIGVAFNYMTYSRHAFAGEQGSMTRFALSYLVSYLLGLALLAAIAQVVSSPYIAGLLTAIILSLINYVVLRRLVFTPQAGQ